MALRKTPQTTDDPTDTDIERPAFELSLTQMIAGTAAAVTAALLGSRLGVAGTLIGAALASIVSMIAGAVYSHSIKAAKHRVMLARTQHQTELETSQTGVLPVIVAPDDPTERAFGQAPPAMMPLAQTAAVPPVTSEIMPPTTTQPAVPTRVTSRRRLPTMVLAGVGALAAFGMSLILLTGIETVSGNPVSGGQPGGLTILGGQATGQADEPEGVLPDSPATDSSSTTASTSESSTGSATTSETRTETTTVTETVAPSDQDTSAEASSSGPSSSSTSSSTSSTSATSSTSPTTSSETSSSAGSTPPVEPETSQDDASSVTSGADQIG